MIVITNIDFLEVDEDKLYNVRCPDERVPLFHNGRFEGRNAAEIREMTQGRRFVRPSDGTDVVIASTREAQDILGIQYEAWENMSKMLNAEIRGRSDLGFELNKIRRANTWSRIKWLFTGVK